MSLARRVDAATGVEERLEHVPTDRGLLYTWAARPQQPASCVVICSSVFGDFTANYQRERRLGRSLASMGYGVIRFHYAGEGNSEGERSEMTFSSMCEDAEAVFVHAESLGFTTFAFLGTRLGALVASSTVASRAGVPLALWEPIAEPLRFIRDAERAKRISELAKDRAGQSRNWRQELEERGLLDLLGYDVHAPFIDSLEHVDFLSVVGFQTRQTFIARFHSRREARDPLAETLVERGFTVESEYFNLSESWFLHSEFVQENRDLIPATTAWLSKVLVER